MAIRDLENRVEELVNCFEVNFAMEDNTMEGMPLTRANFEQVLAEFLERRSLSKKSAEHRSTAREQQIVATFGHESIFPPHLYSIMVRHGVHDTGPAWTPDELQAVLVELQKAARGQV